jgi:hypothetical protein
MCCGAFGRLRGADRRYARFSKTGPAPDQSKSFDCGTEQVPTYNDDAYSRIREQFGAPNSFLQNNWDFKKLDRGGGKGGQLMGFTDDGAYLVKEMSPGDHLTLTTLAQDYADHVCAKDEWGKSTSLLARYFLHFWHEGTQTNYVVMNNWLPGMPSLADMQLTKEVFDRHVNCFDLKGTDDDKTLTRDGTKVKEVHKRIFNVRMWCGQCLWSDGRQFYFEGKKYAKTVQFDVTLEQKKWIKDR